MERLRLEKVSKRFSKREIARLLTHWEFWREGASHSDWFWALDKVDLVLSGSGKRLGIIGANGSGKTTLLRIIAGVTNPTSGTVVVNGRVVPLLEPVAGMQPDLTGRENIALIGTILGMRHREIQRKLGEIVEFAGVSNFLDMPLKHYSLGMIMRLGFSIAIHVDADIILVDEAWGIGDAEFQTKSLERLQQLFHQEATVILVSNDLEIIRRQTDQALWLREGRVAAFGPSQGVIESYLKAIHAG